MSGENFVPSVFRCPKPARLGTTIGNEDLPVNPNLSVEGRPQSPRFTSLGATAPDSMFFDQFGPMTPQAREILNTEAALSWPRQIHLFSENGVGGPQMPAVPFDAVIQFTTGGGRSATLELTASGGAVTVFIKCKTIKIRVANWAELRTNKVSCAVENGLGQQTQDLHRVYRNGGNLAAGATVLFPIPPYARHVCVSSDAAGVASSLQVEMLSDGGPAAPLLTDIMASYLASDGSVCVGAASFLQVRNIGAALARGITADYILGWQ